jgi:hypothetical protein
MEMTTQHLGFFVCYLDRGTEESIKFGSCAAAFEWAKCACDEGVVVTSVACADGRIVASASTLAEFDALDDRPRDGWVAVICAALNEGAEPGNDR